MAGAVLHLSESVRHSSLLRSSVDLVLKVVSNPWWPQGGLSHILFVLIVFLLSRYMDVDRLLSFGRREYSFVIRLPA